MTAAADASFNGTRYRVRGAGRPLVLIHGVGLTLDHFDAMMPFLEKHYRVVAYDCFGHGSSDYPAGAYDMALYVRQLRDLLAYLAITQCDLLGYSMGALIAEGFVLQQPEAVRRLILLSGVFDRNEAERAAVLARVTQARADGQEGFVASLPAALDRYFTPAFRQQRPDVADAVVRGFCANDLDSFLRAYMFFGTADQELTPEVGRISCPTLVITGEDDQRSTASMSRRLAERMPNATLQILAGQRHMPTLEIPEALSQRVRDFLG